MPLITSLETLTQLYYVYSAGYFIVASVAVVIVVLCNLASCVYHRMLAKDDSKKFLIINVLNGHLAFLYQFSTVLFLVLLILAIAGVEVEDDLRDVVQFSIMSIKYFFVIKMTQMSVAISFKHYKPGNQGGRCLNPTSEGVFLFSR